MPPCTRAAATRKRPSRRTARTLIRYLSSLVVQLGDARFPVPAVETRHRELLDVHAVQTSDVHVDPIGMGTRDVEARHTARPTEMMLGGHGAEAIRGEVLCAGEQTEALARHDVMQVPLARTDGAVAVDHPCQVRRDLEAYSPAVAAAGEDAHGRMLDDRFPARQRSARQDRWRTGPLSGSWSWERGLPGCVLSVAWPGPACGCSGSTAATTTASCRSSTRWRSRASSRRRSRIPRAASCAGCRVPSSAWRTSSPATRPPGPSSPPPATGSPTTT